MRLSAGELPLWPRHRRRLCAGLEVLGIPPEPERLEAELETALATFPADGGLKLTVTAGVGQRGYRVSGSLSPTTLCQWFPRSPPPRTMELQPCRYRLPRNPVLAGLKHLNRLDQVLAAAELEGDRQALLCDTAGLVIEGLMHNLFVRRAGEWLTPDLSRCGVQGVMRGLLLEDLLPRAGEAVREADLTPADVLDSDEVFACNAVAGIVPVSAITGQREWHDHPHTTRIDQLLRERYPCFGG